MNIFTVTFSHPKDSKGYVKNDMRTIVSADLMDAVNTVYKEFPDVQVWSCNHKGILHQISQLAYLQDHITPKKEKRPRGTDQHFLALEAFVQSCTGDDCEKVNGIHPDTCRTCAARRLLGMYDVP